MTKEPAPAPSPSKFEVGYLIVDDQEASRRALKEIVDRAVADACERLKVEPALTRPKVLLESPALATAEEFIEGATSLPYWLLVDCTLDGESGEEVISIVKELGYPADVLLYTRAEGALPSLGESQLRYGNAESCKWADLEARLSRMAYELMLKWTDPEYVRGLVLARAVDVEIAMDDAIERFFSVDEKRASAFRTNLLGTHGAALFARVDTLNEAVRIVKNALQAKNGGPATYPKITTGTCKRIFEKTRDTFAHNLLVRDRSRPFDFEIVHKSGGAAPHAYQKIGIQEYFLECSRLLADLKKLEVDLGKLPNTPVADRAADAAVGSTPVKQA